MQASDALLGYRDTEDTDGTPLRRAAWHETRWWRVAHATGFAIGGITFILGTAVLFAPSTDASNIASAALYTAGSLGFLAVDLLELATYTGFALRVNISMSATGSLLYVIGSVGFFPLIIDMTTLVGIGGFIAGSAAIGISQVWKTYRISLGEDGRPTLATVLGSVDAMTAAGVESNAGAGAWLFFVGTVVLAVGPTSGAWYIVVLAVWMAGSIFFTLGAAFLAWRHFVLNVS